MQLKSSFSEIKKAIRKTALQKRDSLSKSARHEKDLTIMQRLMSLPEFKGAKTILFYASFRSEVDTMDIIKVSLEMDKRIVLPKVDKDNHILRLYEIKNIYELASGYMRILEPSVNEDRVRELNDIELIIIPGAAFDIYGDRLGYGAGFYDILLPEIKGKIPLIALAYEEQIVEEIPAEPHDIKVDKIVTDKRLIHCAR